MIVDLSRAQTVADLLEQLGGISPARVRLRGPLGQATEQDVLEVAAREDRLCELVDGVLVEKVMGYHESRLAAALIYYLEAFLRQHDLGLVGSPDGMMRLAPGLVRIPDVSFVSWDRLPDPDVARQSLPALAPDLAVEVLSESNTPAEMDRKLGEYFAAGARLVWYVDPRARTVRVHTSPEQSVLLGEEGTLDGGAVLPGFSLPLHDIFAWVNRPRPRTGGQPGRPETDSPPS